MKKILAAGLSLAMLLSLTACGGTTENTADGGNSAVQSSTVMPEKLPSGNGGVQLGNPYVTCGDAEEMQEQAALSLTLPEKLPDWVTETIYRAMPGKLAEVIYQGGENEIRVRAAEGSEDISGVYGSDREARDVTVGEKTIHTKGADADGERLLFAATWTDGGRTYSVTSTQGVPEETLLELVEEIR